MVDKDKTIDELKELFPVLWDAFEAGCDDVRQFFYERREINRSLAHHILRYSAKEFILDHIWMIRGLIVDNIPSNGLSLRYGKYHIRAWMDTGVDLPNPGDSMVKNAFLRQQSYYQGSLWPVLEDDGQDGEFTNLVLLWGVDYSYNLIGLRLSHPQKQWDPQSNIVADWSIILERPQSGTNGFPSVSIQDELYDLPIGNMRTEEEMLRDDVNLGGSIVDEEDTYGEPLGQRRKSETS